MLIAICDDNQAEREQCKMRLAHLASVHSLDVEFSLYKKGEELLFHLQGVKEQPDIIYLDMRLDGMRGDEVASRLRTQGCTSEIVFITISKDFYGPAFDVRALHYIVKGETTDAKFNEIFLRAVETVRDKHTAYIMCTGAGEFRNIEIRKIRCFQVVKRIVTVFYGAEGEFSFYSTIGKIEMRLNNYGFVRIHRSYLVAVKHIRTISFKEVTLDNGEILPVGRSYYNDLKQKMAEYAGYSDEVV